MSQSLPCNGCPSSPGDPQGEDAARGWGSVDRFSGRGLLTRCSPIELGSGPPTAFRQAVRCRAATAPAARSAPWPECRPLRQPSREISKPRLSARSAQSVLSMQLRNALMCCHCIVSPRACLASARVNVLATRRSGGSRRRLSRGVETQFIHRRRARRTSPETPRADNPARWQ